ncbi:hypothetical protein V8F33_000562 [Rhypophila sp. PSN 637]
MVLFLFFSFTLTPTFFTSCIFSILFPRLKHRVKRCCCICTGFWAGFMSNGWMVWAVHLDRIACLVWYGWVEWTNSKGNTLSSSPNDDTRRIFMDPGHIYLMVLY